MGQYDALLTSVEFAENPYPVYHLLRSKAPVYWCDLWGCWILTRYDDITSSLQQTEHFTSYGRLTATMPLSDDLRSLAAPLIRHYSQGLINVDPPDHTRLRQLVQQAFTPRAVRQLSSSVEAIVDQLLDEVLPRGQMDVIRDFAYPLPVTVIGALMGLPSADHHRLKQWSGRIVEFMATPRPSSDVLLGSQAALLELQNYFRALFRQRRSAPADDLISGLAAAQSEGTQLSEEEAVSTCVTILIGGHETTTNLIASGLLTLIRNPDQLASLRARPELVESAVEEMLRYEGPFQRNRRIATTDLSLSGQTIRKGDLVMQMLGAANRDPDHFPDPDRFDIERTPNRHMAFGYGPHFCLGASLARLEATIAFRALTQRLDGVQLAEDRVEWTNTVFRGLKRLSIIFNSAQAKVH